MITVTIKGPQGSDKTVLTERLIGLIIQHRGPDVEIRNGEQVVRVIGDVLKTIK